MSSPLVYVSVAVPAYSSNDTPGLARGPVTLRSPNTTSASSESSHALNARAPETAAMTAMRTAVAL